MMEDLKMQNFQLVHDLYPERRNALNVKEVLLLSFSKETETIFLFLDEPGALGTGSIPCCQL